MKHPPMDGDDDGLAGAWLRYEGSVAEGSLRLRVRAPSAKCTATIAAIALDDCDGLLQAIDGWLQAEVEWQWENEGEAGELRGRPDSTLALAEVDPVEDGTSRSALPPCRLEVPWSVLRRAGAPPLPLAGRLGWRATPALLTLSPMDLEDAELSAIEAGGAVVLPESMQPQWAGWLHLPGEPPEHGLSVAVSPWADERSARPPEGALAPAWRDSTKCEGCTSIRSARPPEGALAPARRDSTKYEGCTSEISARPPPSRQNRCQVRATLPMPLGAPLLAGWQALDDAIGNLADRPVELWLEPPAATGPVTPTRVAGGRLIPWGNGCAMLVDERGVMELPPPKL